MKILLIEDDVKISSKVGSIVARARLSQNVGEGLLFMSATSANSLVTRLMEVALDPKSRTPSQKACTVKLERNG